MSSIDINNLQLTGPLKDILMAQDISPGDVPSYQICKAIFSYHPMGAKIVDTPLVIAQSQQRTITVPKGPEERLVEAFNQEWLDIGADKQIFNLGRLSQVYGVSSLALLVENDDCSKPIDLTKVYDKNIGVNIFDPLNTAGSLVLNQQPNSMDFLKPVEITVQGISYHRSRTVILMNEDPIYIDYTQSAFGYVGRSAYQRALFPLKSFLNTLTTDDMISLKAGVLIAKMAQQSSAIDNLMQQFNGQKRDMVKEAVTGNVISISVDEGIESLNMQNLEAPYNTARRNIILNIATASGRPAKLLLDESFAEGFGEGTEDAKHIAQFIDRIRIWLQPAYAFFDQLVMYRAWNKDFYKAIQEDFPEYRTKSYKRAFYDWKNSFKATWPSLIEEPDSEKIKVDDVKLKALLAMLEIAGPMMDPENKAILIKWVCDNINALKLLFPSPLVLDFDELKDFVPPTPEKEPSEPAPFAASDSMRMLDEAVSRLDKRVTPRLKAPV